MAYDALTTTEIAVGKPVKQGLFAKIKGNFEYLYGIVGSLGLAAKDIQNGSFEVDSDADGTPDNWTAGVYNGGSKSLVTTTSAHGLRSMMFTHPGGAGNGGGWLQSDYIETGLLTSEALQFAVYCDNPLIKVRVEINWYTAAKALISTSVIYESVANLSLWHQITIYNILADAGWAARYVKVKLIGGYTDTNESGHVYFDDVRIVPAPIALTPAYPTALSGAPLIAMAETIDFGEGSTSNDTFTDLASVSLALPGLAGTLLMSAQVRTSNAAYPASVRIRIGTTYGPVVSTTSESAVQVLLSLDLTALRGSTQTLYLQAKTSVGSAASAFAASPAAIKKAYRTKIRVVDCLYGARWDI